MGLVEKLLVAHNKLMGIRWQVVPVSMANSHGGFGCM